MRENAENYTLQDVMYCIDANLRVTSNAKTLLFQLSIFITQTYKRFLGAITTGCMRPFVPRTNKNGITSSLKRVHRRHNYWLHASVCI